MLSPGDVAWAALIPCALLTLAATVLLGPMLGPMVKADADYWGAFQSNFVRPEPVEHARFLLSLLGPVMLGAVTLTSPRLWPVAQRLAAPILVTAGRIALVAFVVVAVLAQRTITYGLAYEGRVPFRAVYFTVPTLLTAIVFAVVMTIAIGSSSLVGRVGRAVRETRTKRIVGLGAGVLLLAVWMMTAFNTDTSLLSVNSSVWESMLFWIDEPYAILNGQASLVDFNAQYAHLWSYVTAGALAVFGHSFSVYTSVMILGTAVAMLAVLDVFRRLVASSLIAFLLFLPFVATSFFMEEGPLGNRYAPPNLFSLFPVRYGGPFVVLWLVVRRLQRTPRGPPVLIFVFAGLATINNPEFGLPALVATLAALGAVECARTPAGIARLLASAVVGLAGSAAAVAALTLAVAGGWPHFEMLITFPRAFAAGFGMMPMPVVGFHLVLYATFAAAIVIAVVRLVDAAGDVRLTGALLWSGIFGLGAGAYFVGRSHPQVLINIFSAWSLALSLLVIVTVRGIVERPHRRPGLVEALVFACLGLCVCSIAQTPTPWSQWDRIASAQRDAGLNERYIATQRAAVSVATTRGEPVALLMYEGHRIAEDLGLVDVVPYANIDSMPTRWQWAKMLQALRRAGGTKILALTSRVFPVEVEWLRRHGYRTQQFYDEAELVEFVAR